MIIPCNTREFHWTEEGGKRGSFRPTGRLEVVGDADMLQNPIRRADPRPLTSARLFVGFNVRGEPKWSVEDLIPIVTRVREAQLSDTNASFLIQKGSYKSDRTGEIETEDSAQIIIIDFAHHPVDEFRDHMVELGEVLARELDQELVIVEIQRGGVTQETLEIVP